MDGLRATKNFMPKVNWNRVMKKAANNGIKMTAPMNISDMNE